MISATCKVVNYFEKLIEKVGFKLFRIFPSPWGFFGYSKVCYDWPSRCSKMFLCLVKVLNYVCNNKDLLYFHNKKKIELAHSSFNSFFKKDPTITPINNFHFENVQFSFKFIFFGFFFKFEQQILCSTWSTLSQDIWENDEKIFFYLANKNKFSFFFLFHFFFNFV